MEQGLLHDHAGDHCQQDTGGIDTEHNQAGLLSEEGGCKQRIDRQSRPAGHQRRHEDSQKSVTLTVEGPCCHDGRNCTAESDEHGNKCFSRKSDQAHETVHHIGSTGHITGILKYTEHQEHEEYHGNKGGDRLNTGAESVREQKNQPVGSTQPLKQHPEPVHKDRTEEYVEEIYECPANGHRYGEYPEHDREENRNTPEIVHHDRVRRRSF